MKKDRGRNNASVVAGYLVLRFGYDLVVHHPERMLAQVLAVLELWRRGWLPPVNGPVVAAVRAPAASVRTTRSRAAVRGYFEASVGGFPAGRRRVRVKCPRTAGAPA